MAKRSLLQPADVRRKALRLYPRVLAAWLCDDLLFPLPIAGIGRPDPDLAVAQRQVSELRSGSREASGTGYSIEWEQRNSRQHGRNLFPRRVVFETRHDFLQFIGRSREFEQFAAAVRRIRQAFPQLEDWIRSHRSTLIRHLSELDGLLEVVSWLVHHPRPNLFAREMPVNVDTKFVEQHAGILTQWLNIVLPPEAIRADESHFARRFGLRYDEPLIRIRFLDDALRQSAGVPWSISGVPVHDLDRQPIAARHAFIVENKVNLLTLPDFPDAVAIGGLGNAAVDLALISWLQHSRLWYWGDLDVEGFEILARLRSRFPQIRSLLMDEATVERWREQLGGPGSGRRPDAPPQLTESERAAFAACAGENLRIEQERIPQPCVIDTLANLQPMTPSPDS